MLFLTFLFLYHVVNAQKYIIITLTNARAIHSHSPLLLPVKPMTSRLIARFPNIRMIAVHLKFQYSKIRDNSTRIFASVFKAYVE